MPHFLTELNRLIAQGERCALATLVATKGSSPQAAGARIIFLPDGRAIGTIGGGCMEAEARRVALDTLRTGQPKLFDLRLDDDFGWDDGLLCGGQATIFVDPNPARSVEAYAAAEAESASRRAVVLCTQIRGEAAAIGNTHLVRHGDDLSADSGLPPPLPAALSAAWESGHPAVVSVGQEGAVYLEPLLPRPTLLVLGAGHVGASVAQVGAVAGFEVVVVDERPAFADPSRLPFADWVVAADMPTYLRESPPDSGTYVVIVTRGHRHDARCLKECVRSNAAFIGMIGSRRKVTVIFEELLREGFASPEELRRVHAPLGLALGDREVGEIAVSIVAELIAVRRGADLGAIRPMQYTPPFLRDKNP